MLGRNSRDTFIVKQIETTHRQIIEQSRGWFYLSLVAAGIGLILISIEPRNVTSLAGIVANAISVLFFAQSRAANKRADSIQLELIEAYKIGTCVEIVDSIIDPIVRDKSRTKILAAMLARRNK